MAKSAKAVAQNQEAYCVFHQRTLPIENFYISHNPYHSNGVLPYCADCCNAMVYKKIEEKGSLQAAMWLTCAEVGVPFILDVYTHIENESRTKSTTKQRQIACKQYPYFGKYIVYLYQKSSKAHPYATFDETDVPYDTINTLRKTEELIEQQVRDLTLIWGKDTKGEDYGYDDLSYLEWRYTVYTDGITLTEYQASRYRDLCKAEYDINNGIEVEKATKRKADAAKDLHIDQFNIEKEKTDIQKMIEYDAYVMEKYEPAEYYDREELYKDWAYNLRDYASYVLRPIRNLITGSKDYEVTENSKYGGDKDE